MIRCLAIAQESILYSLVLKCRQAATDCGNFPEIFSRFQAHVETAQRKEAPVHAHQGILGQRFLLCTLDKHELTKIF
jgi:hypothetical protein